jgi:hypothetical protein
LAHGVFEALRRDGEMSDREVRPHVFLRGPAPEYGPLLDG